MGSGLRPLRGSTLLSIRPGHTLRVSRPAPAPVFNAGGPLDGFAGDWSAPGSIIGGAEESIVLYLSSVVSA
jgi:hypothetical protein